MTKLWRGAIWLLVCLALVVATAECVSYVANYRAAAKAARLLRDVRALKIGVTTDEEVQRIVQRYGGDVGPRFVQDECDSVAPRWKQYAVEVQSKMLNRIGERDLLRGTSFRQFGASMWRVDASFGVDDRGRLSCVYFQLTSDPVHSESVWASAILVPYDASDTSPYGVGYRGVHYVQHLSAGATTNAPIEQQQRVFDFDLDCLTRIGGCRWVFEVMPSAWVDFQRKLQNSGIE